jgi:hypothetical protein
LVTFSLGVAIMILCIKPLGLRLDVGSNLTGPAPTTQNAIRPPSKPRNVTAVPKVYLAIFVVLVFGILVGFSDVSLASYNLVSNVAGETKLVSYLDTPVAPVGWTDRFEATYTWAQPLFGDGSTWNRYVLSPTAGGDLHAQTSIVADVIDSPDLGSFSAYGVEQCYQFHGYSLANVAQVALGGGITGQTLAFTSQQYGSWSIVFWILPVERGTATVYERVVLYVQNIRGLIAPATEGQQTGIKTITGSQGSNNPQEAVLLKNRDFLVAYARELISVQASKGSKALSKSSVT